MAKGRVRLRDVAERVGVSTATVSLVLNDAPSRISATTADAVRQAAQEMGYQPDLNARGLRLQRTQMIGLLSDLIVTTPYAVKIIMGAQEVAWKNEHLLLIANTQGDAERELSLIDALQARRVDGYLYASMYHRQGQLPASLEGVPLVGVDIEIEGHACYVPDEYAGAEAATRVLLDAGHTRIGHLQGRRRVTASGLRCQAFTDVLSAAGHFDPALIETQDDGLGEDSDFGEEAARRLLSRQDRPTAIFAFNDAMAWGTYRAAAALGLRIPEDLSVVGFDDNDMIAPELRPRLTTVALPHEAMGRAATKELLRLLVAPGRGAAKVHRLACPVVLRDSVAAPASL